MKKKSIAMRLGVAAMALTLVTASMSSGTLAKYVETAEMTGSMILANWNVSAEMLDGMKPNDPTKLTSETIDLSKLAQTIAADGETPISASSLVDNLTVGTGRIAPGMEGYFGVQINTNPNQPGNGAGTQTEVAVDYQISITPGSKPLPTGFTMEAIEERTVSGGKVTWGESVKTITFGSSATTQSLAEGIIGAGATSDKNKKTVWIHWEWPYETGAALEEGGVKYQNDDAHTLAADKPVQANRTFEFTIDATMVQHDPNTPMTQTYWGTTVTAPTTTP